MIGVGVLLNFLVFPSNPGFVSVQPHPAHVVVLVIGLRYGFRASMMAVVMCTLAYGFVLLELANVPTYLYLLDPPYSTPIVVLIPLGVIVGLLSQKHINQLSEVRDINNALQHESTHLRDEREQLRDVNLELAGRVVGAEGTVGQLYEFAKQLNVVSEDKIYEGLLQLLGESLGAERSTIWRVNGSQLQFLVSSEPAPPEGFHPPDFARHAHLFDDRGVLALHDLPEELHNGHMPFLLGKLKDTHSGEVVALVAVDTLPFARYSAESIRLFRMIIEWASTSLGNVNAMRPAHAEMAPPAVAAPTQRFSAQHTRQYEAVQPPAQVWGEISEAQPPSNAKPFSLPEKSIEISAHRLSMIGEVSLTPSDALAHTPVRRSGFLPREDAATILDDMRDAKSAQSPKGAQSWPSQELKTRAFIPSRSMILLAEAGAKNPGALHPDHAQPTPTYKDAFEDTDTKTTTAPVSTPRGGGRNKS